QVEIAASLMGLPQDQVRAALLRQAPAPKAPLNTLVLSQTAAPRQAGAPQRTVVVEYKRASRR
ncbi:MAG: hypothetical protein ABWY35_12110, partial [Pseudorhodoplanes sp.]